MLFREAKQDEIILLFQQGYQEWSKNRSFKQYCNDNSKEDALGKRYVLEKEGEIVSSAIIIRLSTINAHQVFGIGSVLTPQQYRGNGYATELLTHCLHLVSADQTVLFLYSDIDPSFYKSLGFRLLPESLQRYEKSLCMALCQDKVWQELKDWRVEQIPAYF